MLEEKELTRQITLYGEITSEKIEQIVSTIVHFNNIDAKNSVALKDYEPEPIQLYICSCGGELLPSLGLCQLMIHSNTPIITICTGECCSAGFLILSCGHYRMATEGSVLMIHQMMGGASGTVKDCKVTLKSMEKLEESMKKLLKQKTNLPEKFMEQIYNEQIDKYLTVNEALKYKVIDNIYGKEQENVNNAEE